ncbi:MAG: sensor histidine kinase [Acidobacteriota bacterium]
MRPAIPLQKEREAGLHAIAHDARSLVTALGLYCDLLAEPGVLAGAHRHYLDELRLISAATRRLVDELGAFCGFRGVSAMGMADSAVREVGARAGGAVSSPVALPPVPIPNLAAELRASHNMLQAIAGAGITVRTEIDGGESPVRLTGEDLTRVLVNLVKNAAEAMQGRGTLEIRLRAVKGQKPRLVLSVEDSGPGIPEELVEAIFAPEVTSKGGAGHRGLGLAICRAIVEVAGGQIRAANQPGGGARFEIELPVRRR